MNIYIQYIYIYKDIIFDSGPDKTCEDEFVWERMNVSEDLFPTKSGRSKARKHSKGGELWHIPPCLPTVGIHVKEVGM